MSSEEDVFEEDDVYESEDMQYIEEESEEDGNGIEGPHRDGSYSGSALRGRLGDMHSRLRQCSG